MNVEKIAIKLRPRNSWEAIDIGFLLARRWYLPLCALWAVPATGALLAALVLGFCLPGETAKWGLVLFWVFKPLAEPPLLRWVAKRLFGSHDSLRTTLAESRSDLSVLRLWELALIRFSPFRIFSLPVLLLENLKGKRKKERLALLRESSDTVILLSFACFFIELVLTFSLMVLIFWFIPEELRWVDLGTFIFHAENWVLLVSYCISCLTIAPLFICAGFMMYISRRVELEAWDIEIGFRKIRQRLTNRKNRSGHQVLGLILLAFFSCQLLPPCSATELHPEESKTRIETVLRDKEFGQQVTKYRWVLKPTQNIETEKSPWADFWSAFFRFLGGIFESFSTLLARYGIFLIWCSAGAIVAYLLYRYVITRQLFNLDKGTRGTARPSPQMMFGLDIRPESLPGDIRLACLGLLDAGKKREALSLMYRATLSRLADRDMLDIRSSSTERECCLAVRKNRPAQEAVYFEELTTLWVLFAYGHHEPEEGNCRHLLDGWQCHYGSSS